MRRAFAAATGARLVLAGLMGVLAAALLAGCVYETAPRPRPTASIKPQGAKAVGMKPDDAKTNVAKPDASQTEQARAAQARQCAQRHLDRANGTLRETAEQKRDRDEICAAYYRGG